MNDTMTTLSTHDTQGTGRDSAEEITERAGGASPVARPDTVEVRRRAVVPAAVGAVACAVAIAYLARAGGSGSWLDWALCLVMAALGVGNLLAVLDARTPLLVADAHGVRVRLGRTWRGMPWQDLEEIEHTPRRGVFHDGRLVLVPRDEQHELAFLGSGGRRQAKASQQLYGAPFAVPLGLSTRVVGAEGDLTATLVRMAGDAAAVVEVDPSTAAPETPAAEHSERSQTDQVDDARFDQLDDAEPTQGATRVAEPEPAARLVASATPSALRAPATAVRSETTHQQTWGATALRSDQSATGRRALPEDSELRRGTAGYDQRRDDAAAGRPTGLVSIARHGDAVAPLVITDEGLSSGVEPATDPVIGPELTAARTRLGLSVDQLADRTRIRPHVIESIEVDDFAPCGGDFYARGHLRTLARVLGVDAAPLLTSYDATYADAPINPRRVFEAELATGANGSIRGTRGGPNWSVLVAAVMALVLAWSIARLVMDSSVGITPPTPGIEQGSGTNRNPYGALADAVPVTVSAAGGGARVVVRDARGEVVFSGSLPFGGTKSLKVRPPVRVQASDGSAELTVDGVDQGAIGKTGQPAQKIYPVG